MRRALLAPALALLAASPAVAAFNVFSPEQDVEVGRQAAAEVRSKVRLVSDRRVVGFVQDLGERLAAHAPGPEFDYQFEVVDSNELNAFALPGGPIYLHRGVIESARSEGEVAGVLAHEIAHVAHRHGTQQASKAYLGEAGLGLLGGLLGREQRDSDLARFVAGFGMQTLFLKYSREDEREADVTGARMMAAAGYSPADMVSFFELLASQNNSRTVEWLSSHPAPADRASRIRQEIARSDVPDRSPPSSRAFLDARAALGRRASGTDVARWEPDDDEDGRPWPASIPLPSSQTRVHQDPGGLYALRHPANWRVVADPTGIGVTLAPEGGVVRARGRQEVVVGAIVGHFEPAGARTAAWEDERLTLRESTDDLVAAIQRAQPHLRTRRGNQRTLNLAGGSRGLLVTLEGDSPTQGRRERVEVVTRRLDDDHLLYLLFVSPASVAAQQQPALVQMLESLRIDDRRH